MHPAVAECAVVGRPDERCGEVPVAVVVARAGVGADELMAWVAARVAPHKRLHAVRFADALPRTPAGKILRRVLRDQAVPADPGRRIHRTPRTAFVTVRGPADGGPG